MEISRDGPDGTVHAELDTDEPEPSLSVVAALAEIEGSDETELPAIYDCIDHLLDPIFSDPPAEEADVEVSFTYGGYRVTVEQNGSACFVPHPEGEARG